MKVPESLQGLVQGLHHVAIAIEDLDAARVLYVDQLGMQAAQAEPEHVPGQGVRVFVVLARSQRIELLEPTGPETPAGKFLAKRGPGIHHLAFQVPDLQAALDQLDAQGVRLVHRSPQPGSHNTSIAFLHPGGTGGVLMELVQDPAIPAD